MSNLPTVSDHATMLPHIVTPNSVSVTTPDGKTHNITESHANYERIRAAIKDQKWGEIPTLIDVSKAVALFTEGKITVKDGEVLYGAEALHNVITEAIIRMQQEGFMFAHLVLFLDKLMENPSKTAVDELYTFLERGHFAIAQDGDLLAYKRVDPEYKDLHTQKIDNSVGAVVEMRRNEVDDNRNETCSRGLHFCSIGYLASYGNGTNGNHVMIVKVNPRDVVSIPKDANCTKARCCRYEVVAEYTGPDTEDLLRTKPVWSESELRTPQQSEGEEEDDDLLVTDDDPGDTAESDAERGREDGERHAGEDIDDGRIRDAATALRDVGEESPAYNEAFRLAYNHAYDEEEQAGSKRGETDAEIWATIEEAIDRYLGESRVFLDAYRRGFLLEKARVEAAMKVATKDE